MPRKRFGIRATDNKFVGCLLELLVLVAGGLIALPLAILLLALAPVLIPFAIVWKWRHDRHVAALARSTPCTQCGRVLGDDATRLAREYGKRIREEARRKGQKLRLSPLDAICPHCGQHFHYDFEQRQLVPSDTSPAFPRPDHHRAHSSN